jgi:nucleoid-associated protein YgaU
MERLRSVPPFAVSLLVVLVTVVCLYRPDGAIESRSVRQRGVPVSRTGERLPSVVARVEDPPGTGANGGIGPVIREADHEVAPESRRVRSIGHRRVLTPDDSGLSESISVAQVELSRKASASVFTTVRPGERLSDVARRVYGPSADIEKLWRVNRDQLTNPGVDLEAGTVLRTP